MKENLKKIAICLRDFVKDWGRGVVVGGGGWGGEGFARL